MRVVFYESAGGSLGIQYLIAVLKPLGHEVALYHDPSAARDYVAQDFALKNWLSIPIDDVCHDLVALTPDVVCFSLNSYYFLQYLGIIQTLKRMRPDIVIICGGMHVTLLPETVLLNSEIDFAVAGEGEVSFPALIGALAESGVEAVKAAPASALPGVWNRHDGGVVDRGLSPIVKDLDTIPFPDKQLIYAMHPAIATTYCMMASRGCFYNCSYCNSATVQSMYSRQGAHYYRVRSVENVLEELRCAKRRHSPVHVEFFDDIFGVSKRWLQEFCEGYKSEIGIPYGIETNPLVLDEEKIDLLADSGCVTLELGLQSANAVVRDNILKRRETNEEVVRLVRYAAKRGILVELDIIVNLPGEKAEHVQEAIDFVCTARPHMVNLSYLQFLPKTQIIDVAMEQGLLTPEDVTRIEMGERPKPHRFLPRAALGAHYHTLPFRFFLAAHPPERISRPLMRLIDVRWLNVWLAGLATGFLYASRLFLAYRYKRNYFLRWHIRRFAYAALRVCRRKLMHRPGPDETPSGYAGRHP